MRGRSSFEGRATREGEGMSGEAIALPMVAEPAPIPLTVTHMHEHLYCPRFTYFEHVLMIPERQERRTLVQKGRQVHEERKKINPGYLRKKLGVVGREFDVPLSSW